MTPERKDALRLVRMVSECLNTPAVPLPDRTVDDALALGRAAVNADPFCADAWSAFSAACNQRAGAESDQTAAASQATRLAPADPIVWHNYSLGLMRCFRFSEALDASERALSLSGGASNPFLPMQAAFMAQLLGRHNEALGYLDRTCELLKTSDPQYKQFLAEINISRAIVYAKLGDWERFFTELGKRHEHSTHATLVSDLRAYGRLWNQQPRKSEALVYMEWGIGDQIQFARLIPLLRRKYQSITVMCSAELIRLMETVSGVDRAVPIGSISPAVAAEQYSVYPVIDLMREEYLAGGFALGRFEGPYMRVKDFGVPWRVPKGDDRKIRVAFGWQGDRRQPQDFTRRIPFPEFARFAASHPDRYEFVSLQTKFGGYCQPWEGWPADVPVTDCSAFITDMASTAELMARCDVFVGQCGALVHLAGALGLPAVAMLGASHDWRWDFEPLYGENLRMVFQGRPGDWLSAFAQLEDAITEARETNVVPRHQAALLERMG